MIYYLVGISLLFCAAIILAHWTKPAKFYEQEKQRIDEAYSMGEYLE